MLVDPSLYAEEGDGIVGAGFIGSERDGGFAEYVAVPAENAHAVESTLSDEELAPRSPPPTSQRSACSSARGW